MFPKLDPVQWVYEKIRQESCRHCHEAREYIELTPLQYGYVYREIVLRKIASYPSVLQPPGSTTIFGVKVRIVGEG